jgi:hypothetical protein
MTKRVAGSRLSDTSAEAQAAKADVKHGIFDLIARNSEEYR